jgi:hypothetical protein
LKKTSIFIIPRLSTAWRGNEVGWITGITFLKKNYGGGYRDAVNEVDKTRDYLLKMKIHDPDLEFEEFKRMLVENKHKHILLDQPLQEILKNES